MKKILLLAALVAAQASAQSDHNHSQAEKPLEKDKPDSHEHLFTMVKLDQLELREESSNAFKGDLWFGSNRDRLWLKTEWEREDGNTENAEMQALYSRAVTPFWDLQMGLRHDFSLEGSPSRNWAVIGLQGLAPYFLEVDATLFVGKDGDSAIRLEAEYELLFTQRLILSPEIQLDFYGQREPNAHTGSGLSDMEAGLRLRYEITRRFAPYIGVNYEKKFGEAASYARADGENASATTWVIGLRTWF